MKDATPLAGEVFHAATANSNAMMTAQTEQAISQTKAAFEQIAEKSRDAMEQGMKAVGTITGMARGNVDALLESSRIASGGLQSIAREVADFSKDSLERTTSAARALTLAKTAPELMQLQSDFARAHFNAMIGEVAKLSDTMFKLMTEVFEPLQKQAVTAAQIKDLMKHD